MRRPTPILVAAVALLVALGTTFLFRDFIVGSGTAPAPVQPAVVVQLPDQEITPPPDAVAQPVQASNMVSVLTAARDIPLGTRLESRDVVWQNFEASRIQPGFITTTSDQAQVRNNLIQDRYVGAFVREKLSFRRPISENSLLVQSGSGFMSAMLPVGRVAMSIPVTPDSAVSGFILPNDFVDVIVTEQIGEVRRARVLLSQVKVLAIDGEINIADDGSIRNIIPQRSVTVSVTERQALVITEARERGVLSLFLRSVSDVASSELDGFSDPTVLSEDIPESVLNAQQNLDQSQKPIRVIRFGVATNVHIQ